LGGAIAFQFALDYPAMVKTLTIVNSGPSLGGTPEQAQQEIERRVGIVQQLGMRAMGETLGPNLFPKPEHAALRETFMPAGQRMIHVGISKRHARCWAGI